MMSTVAILGVLLTLFAATAVAMRSLFVRMGTHSFHVTHAIYFMILLNVMIIVPTALVVHAPVFPLSPTALLAFIGAGLFGSICGRIFHFRSIRIIGASRADPIKASQPIYGTILAVLFLHESVNELHLLGIILIVIGVAVLSYSSRDSNTDSLESVGAMKMGIFFALTAAFFYALYPVFVRYGLEDGTPLLVGLSVTLLSNAVGFSFFLWWRDELPNLTEIRNKWLVLAGVANSGFLLAYFGALSIAPVVIVLPILQVSPLVVVVFSFLFMPRRLELVTWKVVGISLVIVLGAVMVSIFS